MKATSTSFKTAIWTWISSEYSHIYPPANLSRSIRFFHPDIEHIVYSDNECNNIIKQFPWSTPFKYPLFSLMALERCDATIHIDGDSLVVGKLDEMIALTKEFDFVGVRNNNCLNLAGCDRGITIYHPHRKANIPIQEFINAGAFGCSSKDFLIAWHQLNLQCAQAPRLGFADENDTLNIIFHSGLFKVAIVDPLGSDLSYGISNMWGDNKWEDQDPWESWKSIYNQDGKLYIDEQGQHRPTRISILHQACGGLALQETKEKGFRNWLLEKTSPAAGSLIRKITDSIYLRRHDGIDCNMFKCGPFRDAWDNPSTCLREQCTRLDNGVYDLLGKLQIGMSEGRALVLNSAYGLFAFSGNNLFKEVLLVNKTLEYTSILTCTSDYLECTHITCFTSLLNQEIPSDNVALRYWSKKIEELADAELTGEKICEGNQGPGDLLKALMKRPAGRDDLLLIDDPSIPITCIEFLLGLRSHVGQFEYIFISHNSLVSSYGFKIDDSSCSTKIMAKLEEWGYKAVMKTKSKGSLYRHDLNTNS